MDSTTLLIIVLIVVVAVMMFMRNRSTGAGGPVYRNQTGGTDRPTYNDPDYTSSGSIGGGSVAEPPAQERSVGGGTSTRTNDDPNYRSGGSIG